MKILVLSFYFAPDLSAGSFRASALVRALARRLAPGDTIEVVTTRPNRYQSFHVDVGVAAVEVDGAVTVHRVSLPPHQSGMLDQSRAFLTFQRDARRLVSGRRYDVVVATSSRLMTAVLGSWIARRAQAPLYLDLRDIFVDTIKDVLPGVRGQLARIGFGVMERYAVGRAAAVNLVSHGFAPYFKARYPGRRFSFFSNGIDHEFLAAGVLAPRAPRPSGALPEVLYAGNLGEGQGMHEIIPALAKALTGRARFTIIGDGGRRALLASRLAEQGVDNVVLKPPVDRPALIEAYRQADVLFLHLNDHEAFRKVLPSKLFEYAATGKPILAGVAGHAAQFMREQVSNIGVFAPCDASAAVAAFGALDLACRARDAFASRYSRESISAGLADDVLSLVPTRG